MKKDTKKFLVVTLMSMIFVLLLSSFVFAAVNLSDNPVGKWFGSGGWTSGTTSPNIVRFVLWVIVALTVFSISNLIPGLNTIFTGKKIFLGYIFSFLIGFLAMAYVTPEEIYAMMISYSALGFAIGAGLPIIILFFWTITIASGSTEDSGQQKLTNKILAYVIWGLFGGFILYRIILVLMGAESPGWFIWSLIGIGLFVLLMLFFGLAYLFVKVNKMATKQEIEDLSKATHKSIAVVKSRGKEADALSGKDWKSGEYLD